MTADLVAGPGAALVEAALRGAAVLAIALLASVALEGARASVRHLVLAVAVIGQLALPLLGRVAPGWEAPLPEGWTSSGLPAAGAAGRPTPSPMDDGGARATGAERAVGARASPGRSAPSPLAWIWAVGAATLVARLGAGLVGARRLARAAEPVAGPGWEAAIAEATRRAGLDRPVPVRLSGRVSLPVTCGALRPVVLLPLDAEAWSRRRRALVLVHELAHVGRRDVAVQAAARLACAAFWFDPLAWVALARLRAEAERAADDAVLRGEDGPARYVGELVGLLRGAIRERTPSEAVGFGRGLEARVRGAMGGGPRSALSKPAVAAVTGAALLVTAAVATAGRDAPDRSPAAPVSGCVHVDGRHVNRWTWIDGALSWQVLWEGEGCEVELLARPGAALVDGILVPASPGGEVTIRIARRGSRETLAVARDAGGALLWEVDGAPPADPAALAARLQGLAREIDLHTGFDATARVPLLLAEGGVARVLEEAARTQGDHAAGVYLERLLDARRPTPAEAARALAIAAERVSNDAVMESFLLRVAGEASLSDRSVRAAFDAAIATLESRAARESVRSILP